jgi:glycosyltransferase involved in cell wall biosynthesis
MTPIPILYLIDRLARGGTEGQLIRLVRNLPSEFLPCVGELYSLDGCSYGPSPDLLDELRVPSIRLGFKGFGTKGLFHTVARLVRFVRERRVRIVQTFFQDPHLMGAILKCFAPVRLIGSFRDMGFWRTFLGTAKIRLSDRFYDGYIANSEAVKACSSASFGIDPGKIRVIENGLDTDWAAGPIETGPEKKTVGIVANLNRPVKRVEDFVSMASIVRAKDPDARFVVIGDGYLKEGLVQLSRRLGLDGSISFLGSLSDPMAEISRFGVGVLASESEGLSNAIIEYLACGVPVVVTDTGGNPEIVTQGENGFLVPVGAPSLMAERVLFLLGNPSVAAGMARANRAKVIDRFSLERMIGGHTAYYTDILGVQRCTD